MSLATRSVFSTLRPMMQASAPRWTRARVWALQMVPAPPVMKRTRPAGEVSAGVFRSMGRDGERWAGMGVVVVWCVWARLRAEHEPKMPGAQTLLRYSDLGIDIVYGVGVVCLADVSGVLEAQREEQRVRERLRQRDQERSE
jgi:hypothetical protein